jgi:protease I
MTRVLVISADGFEDSELIQPLEALEEEGVYSDIASLHAGEMTGKRGAKVSANLPINEVEPDSYGMLLLPGGKAPAKLRQNEKVLEITRHFFTHNKPVAAICHGPQILLSAGVLNGKTLTSYHTVGEELKEAGLDYVDREVVVDGNLITSRQPDDLPAFNREIIRMLNETHHD